MHGITDTVIRVSSILSRIIGLIITARDLLCTVTSMVFSNKHIRHWFTPASNKPILYTVLVCHYIIATRIEVFGHSLGWVSDSLAGTRKHKIANQSKDFHYFAMTASASLSRYFKSILSNGHCN